jgi:hypothetical protein
MRIGRGLMVTIVVIVLISVLIGALGLVSLTARGSGSGAPDNASPNATLAVP